MNWRRFSIEATTLVLSAGFCALLANQLVPRERKLNLLAAPPSVAARIPSTQPPETAPEPQPVTPVTDPEPTPSQPAPAKKPPLAKSPALEFPPHPDKPWVEIDSASVRELYKRAVLFIDARRTNVYEQGHIAGARSIPVWESDLNDRLNALYEEGLDGEAPVVVYCSGGDCEDSHMLSERLWGIGFNNVLVYKDGFPDWVKHGGPVETGPARR